MSESISPETIRAAIENSQRDGETFTDATHRFAGAVSISHKSAWNYVKRGVSARASVSARRNVARFLKKYGEEK